MRKIKTDRHLNAEELCQTRVSWLPPERDFLQKSNIMILAPDDYQEDPDKYDIKFSNGEFCFFGDRIINGDEVPFEVDWAARQLVTSTERISVAPKMLKYMTKYRFGTLLIFMSPNGPVLTVVIFRKGGSGVRQQLRDLDRDTSSHVVATATESGNIDSVVWEFALEQLAIRTKTVRGVTNHASKWKHAVALYVDNHASHLNERIARMAFEKWGIVIRPLIKNSSNIMQAVDQNYGVLYKETFKRLMNAVDSSIRIVSGISEEVTCSKPEWRALCIRFISQIVNAVCPFISPSI